VVLVTLMANGAEAVNRTGNEKKNDDEKKQ
jgi:hypothetical protein